MENVINLVGEICSDIDRLAEGSPNYEEIEKKTQDILDILYEQENN